MVVVSDCPVVPQQLINDLHQMGVTLVDLGSHDDHHHDHHHRHDGREDFEECEGREGALSRTRTTLEHIRQKMLTEHQNSPVNLDVTSIVAWCSDICNNRIEQLQSFRISRLQSAVATLIQKEQKIRAKEIIKRMLNISTTSPSPSSSSSPPSSSSSSSNDAKAKKDDGGNDSNNEEGEDDADVDAHASVEATTAAAADSAASAASAVKGALSSSSRQIVVCQSALDCARRIFGKMGGAEERRRFSDLLTRVTVVKDNISDRVKALSSVSKKIKHETLAIFGTGDAMGATTITSNQGFVRSARKNGVYIKVFVHPSRALIGHLRA